MITDGPDAGNANVVPFILRERASADSSILVQASVNTWEAYNNWGGKSLYDFNSTDLAPANRVSFDRPVAPGGQWPVVW